MIRQTQLKHVFVNGGTTYVIIKLSLSARYLEGAANMNTVPADIVRSLLLTSKTYSEISTELQQMYPHIIRGLSTRSLRRYVKEKGLKEICERERNHTIEGSINEVSNSVKQSSTSTLIVFVVACLCLPF